ncbi:SPOR domain-containing protein [Sphingomonas sp. GV3]|uniref:tetratricopeptide repeat protein n=1 Tax=Sphingomonas sp. GV3 TaxID=3040671 RepID=UPI00280BB9E8|nr:SPOR domain-containing protein [Sphingomonas sp. GV3]
MRVFLPAILALAFAPAALPAQEVVQPLPGTTDADRLAEQMRALASNPRDVNALVAAGDLSLKLDDLSGAASLFARAEKVAPADPRIKAGEGAILVRSERPGEALRYFAQAEAGGLDARTFAADRGLAYDLVGQQERAQRDYRLALKTAPSDEIVRRYALSLGISGKRQEALDALDPLLRKQDRSAWRTRAFVLAMGGDQAGAEKIAATMLPGGMAQGLQPFFQRLPTLPAADRAFAVHFGEVRATPERIADARLAPAMPYLAPEPSAAPVALAAATTPVVGKPVQRGNRRERQRPGRVQMVAATPAPVAPSYTEATRALASVQPVPASTGAVTLAAATVPVAPVSAVPAAALSSSGAPTPTQPVTVQPAPVVQPAPARVASVQPSVARAVVSQPSTVVATPSPRQAQPVVSAPQQPTQFAAASVTQPLPATATVQPIPRPASPAYAGSTVSPAAPAPVATTAAVTRGRSLRRRRRPPRRPRPRRPTDRRGPSPRNGAGTRPTRCSRESSRAFPSPVPNWA